MVACDGSLQPDRDRAVAGHKLIKARHALRLWRMLKLVTWGHWVFLGHLISSWFGIRPCFILIHAGIWSKYKIPNTSTVGMGWCWFTAHPGADETNRAQSLERYFCIFSQLKPCTHQPMQPKPDNGRERRQHPHPQCRMPTIRDRLVWRQPRPIHLQRLQRTNRQNWREIHD